MSWNPAIEPGCPDQVGVDAIETLIVPRARDLGGFEVRRALPAPNRQMVGPFIFFDQAGPAELLTGQGVDVRPHPHIGLGTVTYLYRGDFHHRDSTGADQIIKPGELNWMVAGRGVSHSERTSSAARTGPNSLFGIQTWLALPDGQEDVAPSFEHHGRNTLPMIEDNGISARLILGNAYGEHAPARMFSETFYADVKLNPLARLPMPDEHEDRAIYVVEGSISVAGQEFGTMQMMVFRPGDSITVAAGERGARIYSGAQRSVGQDTSGGILSPRRWNVSKTPRPNGEPENGARAVSTFLPTTAGSSYPCPIESLLSLKAKGLGPRRCNESGEVAGERLSSLSSVLPWSSVPDDGVEDGEQLAHGGDGCDDLGLLFGRYVRCLFRDASVAGRIDHSGRNALIRRKSSSNSRQQTRPDPTTPHQSESRLYFTLLRLR
ncbi:pirin domain-containing protein (plasmid) [Rhizobium sp. N541]|nr:pirin domain-containing protein [Rhizobium sp. N541]ANM26098.1 pirin domain-containing protein [Rhizobium sp. N941]